jgi:hypothetical protein
MALNWFPDIYQTLINNFSGTKKYIDASVGSNSNDGNSETSAYSTIEYAQSQTSGVSTAVMYVINPGTYNLTPVNLASPLAGFASAGISDYNLPRIFVCSPDNRVILQWTAEASLRDAPMVSFQNSNSAIYGAVLKRNNNGKSLNYSVAMFNGSTAHCQGDFYNCVFAETNSNGNWSLQYDNAGVNNSTINNCTVYTIEAGDADYSGGAGLVLNNCAFTHIWGSTSATRNNNVTNQSIDSTTYQLSVNNTASGVYSGTYAWGQSLPAPGPGVYAPTSAEYGDTVDILLITELVDDGTLIPYTITGINSSDINNFPLTGNFTIIGNTGTISFTATPNGKKSFTISSNGFSDTVLLVENVYGLAKLSETADQVFTSENFPTSINFNSNTENLVEIINLNPDNLYKMVKLTEEQSFFTSADFNPIIDLSVPNFFKFYIIILDTNFFKFKKLTDDFVDITGKVFYATDFVSITSFNVPDPVPLVFPERWAG